MNASTSSRQQILDRIHAAGNPPAKGLADARVAHALLPHNYLRSGKLNSEARLHLMIERLREYDAEVTECMSPEQLPAVLSARLAATGKHTFLAPEGLPAEWLIPGYDWKIDHCLPTAEIEKANGVVTAAYCGIADSGTIVLHHAAAEGRRVITLLPDFHVCILRTSQLVESTPEYFNRCKQPPALATYISGPSATADIEMTRIKGVHGPRYLDVILVHDESKSAQTGPQAEAK